MQLFDVLGSFRIVRHTDDDIADGTRALVFHCRQGLEDL